VGSGTVTRSPDLVEYPEGTLVTLTAVPAEGWRLVGWTGDQTGTEAELAFAINAATSVTATFEEIPVYGLTVNTVGSGTVTRSPDLVEYPEGTLVTLTAVPAEGWRLVGWSGDLTSAEPVLEFAINAATSVTATFEEIPV